MSNHIFPQEPHNFSGHLSRDLPEVLTIEPGDRIDYTIPDAGWGIEGHNPGCRERRTLVPDVEERGLGHCLAGPVYVKGAEAGMVLEVKVHDIVPSAWGWTVVGWPGSLNDRLRITHEPPRTVCWKIDWAAGTACSDFGYTIPVMPFLGFMGVAPPMNGRFSTIEPYAGGGNLDCRELVAGSSLFLPIHVDGAMFFCGDCHAAQGDGELCGTALECATERAVLSFDLHDEMPYSLGLMTIPFPRPVAKTPAGWITFGLHTDIDEAMVQASDAMIALVMHQKRLDRADAVAIVSTQVSFRITQAVNGVKGIHALLPQP